MNMHTPFTAKLLALISIAALVVAMDGAIARCLCRAGDNLRLLIRQPATWQFAGRSYTGRN